MGKDLNGNNLGRGLSQRKDGRYEARAVIGSYKIDIYNTSLAELKKEFEAAKDKARRDEKGIRPSTLTLSEWFEEWFEKYKRPNLKSEVSSKVYYRKINNTYIKILGMKYIKDISQLDIQTATNELIEEGFTSRTVREALGVLKECFEIALLNKVTTLNPVQFIQIRDANLAAKERRVLSLDEQEIFLEEIKDSYYYEAYKILLLTGMRIGEFSGLQWNDIDWKKKVIIVNRSMSTAYQDGRKIIELTTPKTANSYRSIPFFGETETLLKDWKRKQDMYKKKLGDRWRCEKRLGDLVFTSTMGSPVTRYVIAHDLSKIEKNINLKEQIAALREGREPILFEHIHPHAFRHTFATRCFEKQMDPLVIQKIMGHSDYNVTLSYTHVLNDKIKEEVDKVGNFFEIASNQILSQIDEYEDID